ncbi:MAG: class I SAM-dependent methyltransferase [Acidobacteriota bacterium]
MAATISYALKVLAGRLRLPADNTCPYCHSSNTESVGKKHLIMQLRICRECSLKYRYPKDDPNQAESFYQHDYKEATVTDLPTPVQLVTMRSNNFKGSNFDKSEKADFIVSNLGPNVSDLKVLDYGASFGYFVSQVRSRGVGQVIGYEISRPRAKFGVEMLGEKIYSSLTEVLEPRFAPFDAIYTCHVLEHLTRPSETFEFFRRALKRPNGKLFIWTPNASQAAIDRHYQGSWAPLVGEPHPLALDYEFFDYALPKHGFKIVAKGEPSHQEVSIIAETI